MAMSKFSPNRLYEQLSLTEKLTFWQQDISDWHNREEAMIGEDDIIELQGVLGEARKVIDEHKNEETRNE